MITLVLMIHLFGSSYANAMAVADAAAHGLQSINNGVQSAWKAMDEAWKSATDEFNKSAWGKQLKGMWDQISELKKNVNQVMALRNDFMNTLSGMRNTQTEYPNEGKDGVNYRYAEGLPHTYISVTNCDPDSGCSATSSYTGKASGASSSAIRNTWKIPESLPGTLTIEKLTYQAAEEYAQQIAVIQAMAQEAYAQANNRIKKIEDLEKRINGAIVPGVGQRTSVNTQSTAATGGMSSWSIKTPSVATGDAGLLNQYSVTTNPLFNTYSINSLNSTNPYSINSGTETIGSDTAATAGDNSASTDMNKNDLKYIADLQARIQVEQALLINDQNKLASLAILQQSVTDAYEQRKRELAAYVTRSKSSDDIMATLEKVGVAAAQKASYEAIAAWYVIK